MKVELTNEELKALLEPEMSRAWPGFRIEHLQVEYGGVKINLKPIDAARDRAIKP
jgi:hypothetical protein